MRPIAICIRLLLLIRFAISCGDALFVAGSQSFKLQAARLIHPSETPDPCFSKILRSPAPSPPIVLMLNLAIYTDCRCFVTVPIREKDINQGRHRMKTQSRVLIAIVFIFLLTTTIAAQTRRKSRAKVTPISGSWYIFTGPDRDFTLTFPQRPEREPDAQGIVTILRSYGVSTESGMRFSINFQDLGGDPRALHNNEWAAYLEQMSAEAARSRGERVVQVHRLAKNIVEMEFWRTVEGTGENINYLDRSILQRGRIYNLGCGSIISAREVDKLVCRKFFNSMRFIR